MPDGEHPGQQTPEQHVLDQSQPLSNKVALITGGASGIGAATVRTFVDAGAKVMIGDIDSVGGSALAEEYGRSRVAFETLDVRSGDAIAGVVDRTVDLFGRLDIVFNNAGIGLNAPLTEHSEVQIDDLIDINLRAVIMACRAALPHLQANPSGGVLLNNASNGGLIGRAADPVYVATKHAVIGLTKSLALAHAHQNIRVNAVCPGPIDTPMVWGNFTALTDRNEALRRILATCPDARLASPYEVAAAALFLASDAARFINGIALPIDGAKAAGVMTFDRYRLDFPLAEVPEDQVAGIRAGWSS